MSNYKYVLWDWNGTLIQDVPLTVLVTSYMLRSRNKLPITMDVYRNVFNGVLKDAYSQFGFDLEKESPSDLSMEFARIYVDKFLNTDTHLTCYMANGAVNLLSSIKSAGYCQLLLTASNNAIVHMLLDRFNIRDYFVQVLAQTDFSGIKTDNAERWMYQNGIDPTQVLLIGDTAYDAHVAQELKCDCVLISNGHQARTALVKEGVPVFTSFADIYKLLNLK